METNKTVIYSGTRTTGKGYLVNEIIKGMSIPIPRPMPLVNNKPLDIPIIAMQFEKVKIHVNIVPNDK
jgi:hypothetical protein